MKILNLLWEAWLAAGRANIGLAAAGVAFYALFSIFPGLAALIALFGLIADPGVVDSQLELMRDLIPEQIFLLLEDQLSRLLSAQSGTLGWTTAVSISIALWSARAGVGALMTGLTAVHGRANRGGVWHALTALALTAVLIAMAGAALLLVVVTPVVLSAFGIAGSSALALEIVRWSATVGLLLSGLWLLYRFGPAGGGANWPVLSPGSVFAILIWFGASQGLAVYLTNFASYNQVYGSIGAVVALLMWFYITAYLVLLGAALDVALDRSGGGQETD
jgi:membrane protein